MPIPAQLSNDELLAQLEADDQSKVKNLLSQASNDDLLNALDTGKINGPQGPARPGLLGWAKDVGQAVPRGASRFISGLEQTPKGLLLSVDRAHPAIRWYLQPGRSLAKLAGIDPWAAVADYLNQVGQAQRAWTEETLPLSQEVQAGGVRGMVAGGVESAVQSALTSAPALLAGPAAPVVAGALTAGTYYAPTYLDAYDEAIKQGVAPDKADTYAKFVAASEAGSEGIGEALGFGAMKIGKLAGPAKRAARQKLLGQLLRESGRDVAKAIGKDVAIENVEEIANLGAKSAADAVAGVKTADGKSGMAEFKSLLLPTVGTTVVATLLQGGAMKGADVALKRRLAERLANPQTDPVVRADAAYQLAAMLEAQQPNAGRVWLEQVGPALRENKPLDLGLDAAPYFATGAKVEKALAELAGKARAEFTPEEYAELMRTGTLPARFTAGEPTPTPVTPAPADPLAQARAGLLRGSKPNVVDIAEKPKPAAPIAPATPRFVPDAAPVVEVSPEDKARATVKLVGVDGTGGDLGKFVARLDALADPAAFGHDAPLADQWAKVRKTAANAGINLEPLNVYGNVEAVRRTVEGVRKVVGTRIQPVKPVEKPAAAVPTGDQAAPAAPVGPVKVEATSHGQFAVVGHAGQVIEVFDRQSTATEFATRANAEQELLARVVGDYGLGEALAQASVPESTGSMPESIQEGRRRSVQNEALKKAAAELGFSKEDTDALLWPTSKDPVQNTDRSRQKARATMWQAYAKLRARQKVVELYRQYGTDLARTPDEKLSDEQHGIAAEIRAAEDEYERLAGKQAVSALDSLREEAARTVEKPAGSEPKPVGTGPTPEQQLEQAKKKTAALVEAGQKKKTEDRRPTTEDQPAPADDFNQDLPEPNQTGIITGAETPTEPARGGAAPLGDAGTEAAPVPVTPVKQDSPAPSAPPISTPPAVSQTGAESKAEKLARLRQLLGGSQGNVVKEAGGQYGGDTAGEIIQVGMGLTQGYLADGITEFEAFARAFKTDAPDLWDGVKAKWLKVWWDAATGDNPKFQEISRAEAARVAGKIDGETGEGKSSQQSAVSGQPAQQPDLIRAAQDAGKLEIIPVGAPDKAVLQSAKDLPPHDIWQSSGGWKVRISAGKHNGVEVVAPTQSGALQAMFEKLALIDKQGQGPMSDAVVIPETESDDPALVPGTGKLIEAIRAALADGTKLDNPTLDRMATEAFGSGKGSGKWTSADAYDAVEAGLNSFLLERAPAVIKDKSPAEVLQWLRDLVSNLPRQTSRTAEKDAFQQFSTPPTEAYLLALAAKIKPGDVFLEPSAGVGSLAIWAKIMGATVHVNEIAPRRAALLKAIGFENVTSVDGEALNDVLDPSIRPTVIGMNPPFSATGGRVAKNKTAYGAKHVEQALWRLSDGGRLVAIVGEGMALDRPRFVSWWQKMADQYTVLANLGIPGEEYGKFGTTFGNQVLVFDKTGPTPGIDWKAQLGNIIHGGTDNLESALKRIESLPDRRGLGGAVQPATPGGDLELGLDQVPASPGNGPATPVGGGTSGGSVRPGTRGTGRPAGGPAKTGPETGAPTPAPSKPESPVAGTGGSGAVSGSGGLSADVQPSGSVATPQPSTPPVARQDEAGGAFVKYAPSVNLGGKKHPADLVESASMAAVEPVQITAVPSEKLRTQAAETGMPSDVQLEAIALTRQRHSQTLPGGERAGVAIGAGTGVGKGIVLAGGMADAYHQDGVKRFLWLSVSNDLIESSARDLKDVGLGFLSLNQLNEFSATERLDAKMGQGVIFATYSTLIAKSKSGQTRLQQLVDWLGNDGYVVFDEGHKAANALAGTMGQPTQTGLAVIGLQDKLPKLRVVYSSATQATEARHLAYMPRLGLWGKGTPFANVQDFIGQLSDASAMEMVARDMKALGTYWAPMISYQGVTHATTEHTLTPEQEKMQLAAARAWQAVMQNIEQALDITNSNAWAKMRAMSAFWSGNQRFWRTVLAGFKMPTVIQKVDALLKSDHAVVIMLEGTGEARTKELVNKAAAEGEDLDALDFTPRETLGAMIEAGFPTVLFQDVTDPSTGQIIKVPVKDKDGNPVHSQVALAMKQKLLDSLSDLQLPDNPLDQLRNHYGDNFAEISGRKKVLKRNPTTGKVEYVKRAADGVPGHKVNTHEAGRFMDGKALVAGVTPAGSVGITLHSWRRAKNQRRRAGVYVELPWSATIMVQKNGRIHRSDLAPGVLPPHFEFIFTNVGGEKRFVSSAMRRMGQLGSLSRGERSGYQEAGNLSEFNLETVWGEAALARMYDQILNGREVPGLANPQQALQDMGLLKEDENGRQMISQDDHTNVTRFLNRVLALPLAEQNALFDYFATVFDQVQEFAKANGLFDAGVNDIKGDKIEFQGEPSVVATDPTSGAKTQHVQLAVTNPTHRLAWAVAAGMEVARNVKSGNFVAFEKMGRITDPRTGSVIDRVILHRPSGTTEIMADPDFRVRYEKDEVASDWDKADAEKWWRQELERLPKTETRTHHIIAGALLPIWRKLQVNQSQTQGVEIYDKLRIVRVKTDDGRRVVGVEIPSRDIAQVLQQLGVKAAGSRLETPAQVSGAVLHGEAVNLVGGLTLRKGRVGGEDVIRVDGAQSQDFTALRDAGLLNERKDFKQVFWVPTDANRHEAVLGKLLDLFPVVDQGGTGKVAETGGEYRTGEADGASLTNKEPATVAKPIKLDAIPREGDNYEVVPANDPDPLGYGNEKYLLSPSGRWLAVEDHQAAAREVMRAAGLSVASRGQLDREGNADQAALQLQHNFARVVDEGDTLYFSHATPTASQLRELKNVAIERKMRLVQDAQQGRERVLYDPADDAGIVRETGGEYRIGNAMGAETFYHKSERVAAEKLPAKGTGPQMLGILRNNGVKPAELAAVKDAAGQSLEAWLSQAASVTKDDVLAFIQSGKVQVREVTRDEDVPPIEWESVDFDDGDEYKKSQGWQSSFLERDGETGRLVIRERPDGDAVGGYYTIWSPETGHDQYETDHESLEDAKEYATKDIFTPTVSQWDSPKRKSTTKFRHYMKNVPTDEGYFEWVLTVPEKRARATLGDGFKSPYAHAYGDEASDVNRIANVIGSVVTIAGKKYLAIWEVQSDWAADMRKFGEKRAMTDAESTEYDELRHRQEVHSRLQEAQRLHDSNVRLFNQLRTEQPNNRQQIEKYEKQHIPSSEKALARAQQEASKTSPLSPTEQERFSQLDDVAKRGVTGNPLLKKWEEVAMKAMFRKAADMGLAGVVWNRGQTVAERYDLRTVADQVDVKINGSVDSPRYQVAAWKDGDVVSGFGKEYTADELPGVIGKDLAAKAIAQLKDRTRKEVSFTGDDLKVGAHWAENLYDRALVSFVNDYTKKWGGKVETASLPDTAKHKPVSDREARAAWNSGKEVYAEDADGDLTRIEQDGDFAQWEDGQFYVFDGLHGLPVHRLDFTPEMKAAVLTQGQSLFEKGPSYGRATETKDGRKNGLRYGDRGSNVPGNERQAASLQEIARQAREVGAVQARGAEARHVSGSARTDILRESAGQTVQQLTLDFSGKPTPAPVAVPISPVDVAQFTPYAGNLKGSVLDTPQKRALAFRLFRDPRLEHLHAVLVDKNHVAIAHIRSEGGVNWSSLPIDEMIAVAEANPHGVEWVLGHNHPSGDPTPSLDDVKATKDLRQLFDTGVFMDATMKVWKTKARVKLASHTVINGGKFVVIGPTNAAVEWEWPFTVRETWERVPLETVPRLEDGKSIAAYMKAVGAEQRPVLVALLLSTKFGYRGALEIPLDLTMQGAGIRALGRQIADRAKAVGALHAALVTNVDIAVPAHQDFFREVMTGAEKQTAANAADFFVQDVVAVTRSGGYASARESWMTKAAGASAGGKSRVSVAEQGGEYGQGPFGVEERDGRLWVVDRRTGRAYKPGLTIYSGENTPAERDRLENNARRLNETEGEPAPMGGPATVPTPDDAKTGNAIGMEAAAKTAEIVAAIEAGGVLPSMLKRVATLSLIRKSGVDTLRQIGGEVGKRLAPAYEGYVDTLAMLSGKLWTPFERLVPQWNRKTRKAVFDEFENILLAREAAENPSPATTAELARRGVDGQTADELLAAARPETRELIGKVRTMFGFTSQTNQDMLVYVWQPGKGGAPGSWRPIGTYGEEYWPRVLREEIRRVLDNPTKDPVRHAELLTELMDKLGTTSSAIALDHLKASLGYTLETGNDFMSNLELARQAGLPQHWYEHRFERLVPHFIPNWARRISQIKHFGQHTHAKQQDLFDTVLKGVHDTATEKYVKEFRNRVYEVHRGMPAERAMQALRAYTVVTKLANWWTAIRNSSTMFVNVVPEYGVKAAVPELLKLWQIGANIRSAREIGILRADLIAGMAEAQEFSERQQKAIGVALKVGLFSPVENWTRATTAAITLNWARWNLARMEAGHGIEDRSVRLFLGKLKKLGVDIDQLRADGLGGLEGEKLLRAAVTNTQFSYDLRQTPLWAEHPIAKFLFQFQKFGLQQWRRIEQDVLAPAFKGYRVGNKVTRDFGPLLYFLALTIGTGAALLWLRELLFGKRRPDAPWKEINATWDENKQRSVELAMQHLFHDAIYAGGFGVVGDWAANAEDFTLRTRGKSPLNPPGLSAADNLWNNVVVPMKDQGRLTLDDLDRFARQELPFYNYGDAVARQGLRAAGDAIGKEFDAAQRQRIRADLGEIKRVSNRYLTETQGEGRTGMSAVRTPRTPAYNDLQDALLLGDTARAKTIKEQILADAKSPSEKAQALTGMQGSVRNRRPLKVGGAEEERSERLAFADWLARRRPDLAPVLKELDARYLATAHAVGLGQHPLAAELADQAAAAREKYGLDGWLRQNVIDRAAAVSGLDPKTLGERYDTAQLNRRLQQSQDGALDGLLNEAAASPGALTARERVLAAAVLKQRPELTVAVVRAARAGDREAALALIRSALVDTAKRGDGPSGVAGKVVNQPRVEELTK